jgi:hypothetical protein
MNAALPTFDQFVIKKLNYYHVQLLAGLIMMMNDCQFCKPEFVKRRRVLRTLKWARRKWYALLQGQRIFPRRWISGTGELVEKKKDSTQGECGNVYCLFIVTFQYNGDSGGGRTISRREGAWKGRDAYQRMHGSCYPSRKWMELHFHYYFRLGPKVPDQFKVELYI